MEATIYESLAKIQDELKAPKDQYNSFGKYKYRSAEGILESLKPLLKKYGCLLWIYDEVVSVGDRIYVKSIVTIEKRDGGGHMSACAYAREADTKAGMDPSQITGAASSYARKYALNGLLAIDDTKDADALNTSPEYTAPAPRKTAKPECPNDVWKKLVMMEVEGKTSKTGLSGIQYLREKYYTNEATIALFEGDVQMARDAKAVSEASLNDPNQHLV